MLYLREGWLVGNSGLLGALSILAACYLVTGTTALSLSSLATNHRVRAGGAFAIISQALGLEAGGAIGLPLFIAQAASSALYLYAFTEAVQMIAPGANPTLVVAVSFVAVALVASHSAKLALRAQAVMFLVVGIALASAFLGIVHAPTAQISWVGSWPDRDWFETFALFFPAATGIMVGVGMSGSLASPRRSLPWGTLSAWAVTGGVYVLFAFWYAAIAPSQELLTSSTVIRDHALVPFLVVAGLLASTLMAALASLVSATRLLTAMAEHGVVPGADRLARKNAAGAPVNATLVTTCIAGLALLTGSLDAVAPWLTSFFITTYLAVNVVVLMEQRLSMISFRPTFAVPLGVPLTGACVCGLALSLASPGGGLVEILAVSGIYIWLVRKDLRTPWETVESGVAVTVAAWAARKAAGLEHSERAWKPDLLVPVSSTAEVQELMPLVEALTNQGGSVKLVGVDLDGPLGQAMERTGLALRLRGVHTTWTALEDEGFARGLTIAMDVLQGALFPPNLVVVHAGHHDPETLQRVLDRCRRLGVGALLYLPQPGQTLGKRKAVHVWLSDRSPEWALKLHLANLDLPVMCGYLLTRAWGGRLGLFTVVRDSHETDAAKAWLRSLVEMGRMPPGTTTSVWHGSFLKRVANAPDADLHIFGLGDRVHVDRLLELREASRSSCIFLLDSGRESLLA
jgi:amino acid transporter